MSRERPTAGIASAVGFGGNARGGNRALVAGGGHIGRTVASHLSDDYDVAFVSRNRRAVERTERDGIDSRHVEEMDAAALGEIGVENVSVAIVASPDEAVNFLVAQLLRTRFGVENVVLRVDDCEKMDSFDDLDVEAVCIPDLLVEELAARLESFADDVAEP
ncbi:NAD(P)-binding protein [Halorussus pelagicus]|uniref:NAD(P)-binding protein n=1 Tax=Halorussus pelagicus TaxID=2505977 RepID=UPI000FFC5FD9|nr:NAD-binding protein [Halorussus pelagicus]